MTKEELTKILENHLHWLKEDCDGWENMRADLRYADLRNAKYIPMACPDTGSFIGWKKDGTVSKRDMTYSQHNHNFYYEVGKTVNVDNFDEDRFNECAPGIHFFINRQEAVDY